MSDEQVADSAAPKDRTKSAPTPTRAAASTSGSEEKRPNVFRRIWIFVTQVVSEMKKVTWPTPNETWTYFLVVVVFVAVVMAFTGVLDFGFGKLNALIFG